MIRRPPRVKRTDTPFPTRLCSDLMIMRPERVGRDPPAARHAKMKDQGVAAIGFDQPVFRAPAKPAHPSAGQPLAQVDGDRAAQIRPARLDADQHAPLEYGAQAANGGFRSEEQPSELQSIMRLSY